MFGVKWTIVKIFICIAILTGCSRDGSDDLNNSQLDQIQISIVSGANMAPAVPATQFSLPITFEVLDAESNPVGNTPVTFIVIDKLNGKPVENGSYKPSYIATRDDMTDQDGRATTTVIAGSLYKLEVEIILTIPSLNNKTHSVTLKTSAHGTPFGLKLSTTGNLKEIAGEPFAFVVSIVDENGYTVDNFDAQLSLNWNFVQTPAWASPSDILIGQDTEKKPLFFLPESTLCEFSKGVCQTEAIYYFSNALQRPLTSIEPNEIIMETGKKLTLQGVTNLPITIEKGSADHIVATTGLPVETESGQFPTIIHVNSAEALTLYAAIVDKGGNFLERKAINWTGRKLGNGSIAPQNTSDFTTFTPVTTGEYRINMKADDLEGTSPVIQVSPGDFDHLAVNSEHNLKEQAGVCFSLHIFVRDSHENIITSFSGYRKVLMEIVNADSGNPVRSPAHFRSNENLGPRVLTEMAINGGILKPSEVVCLNDATDVSPKIRIDIAASETNPLISGFSQTIEVAKTELSYILLSEKTGDNAEYLCSAENLHNRCLELGADSNGKIYYAAAMDKGGNFLENPPVTWRADFPLDTAILPVENGIGLQVTPEKTGVGYIYLTGIENAFEQKISFKILPGKPHHLQILTEHEESEIATVPFGVSLASYDIKNNLTTNLNTAMRLEFDFDGATASPAGTAPVHPNPELVEFKEGMGQAARTQNNQYYIPNTVDRPILTVTISADDKSGYSLQESRSNRTFIKAGPVVRSQIEDKKDGTGKLVPSGLILTTMQVKEFYAAGYDIEGNYAKDIECFWQATDVLEDYVVLKYGKKTVLEPKAEGDGILNAIPVDNKISPSATPNIVVEASMISKYSLRTTHDNVEMADVKFGFIISALDQQNNVVLDYMGGIGNNFIQFDHNATASWAGNLPELAKGTIDCTFINGVCNIDENYKLVNVLESPSIFIQDANANVDERIPGMFSATVSVLTAAAKSLLVVDGRGGPGLPSDPKFPLINILNKPFTFTTDGYNSESSVTPPYSSYPSVVQADIPFYAAVVDAGGNYLYDTEVKWQITAYDEANNAIDPNNIVSQAQNLSGFNITGGTVDITGINTFSTDQFSFSSAAAEIRINPKKVGIFTIKIKDSNVVNPLSQFLSEKITFIPGKPDHVEVITEHEEAPLPEDRHELPGQCFQVSFKIKDGDNNTVDDINANVASTLNIIDADTPYGQNYYPDQTKVLEVRELAHFNYSGNPLKTGGPQAMTLEITSGIVVYNGNACLYDATAISPKITIDIDDFTDNSGKNRPALTGESKNAITLPPGEPDHLQIFVSGLPGDAGTPAEVISNAGETETAINATVMCKWIDPLGATVQSETSCFSWENAGVAIPKNGRDLVNQRTFYAGVVDYAGNFLGLVDSCDWSGTVDAGNNPFSGSQLSASTGNSVVWTPKFSNLTAKLRVENCTSSSLTTTNPLKAVIPTIIYPGPPHHFDLFVNDSNTVSVTDLFAVKVTVKDQFGNTVVQYNGGQKDLVWTTNASNSPIHTTPAPSAPTTPANGTVTFNTGVYLTAADFSLPNASGTFKNYDANPGITLSGFPLLDTGDDTAGITPSTTTINLTVVPSNPTAIELRDADKGFGNKVTELTMGTDEVQPLFIAGYDSKGNYVAGVRGVFGTTFPPNPEWVGVNILPTNSLYPPNTNWNGTDALSTDDLPIEVIGITEISFSPKTTGTESLTVQATGLNNGLPPYTINPINVGATTVSRFMITTNNKEASISETAGAPFTLIVKILDPAGNVVTSFGNGSIDYAISLTHNATNSWTGYPPNLPDSVVTCTFTNGICEISQFNGKNIYFTSADESPTLFVEDPSTAGDRIPSISAVMLTVIKGPLAKMIITDGVGGPGPTTAGDYPKVNVIKTFEITADGYTPTESIPNPVTQQNHTFYSAAIDAGGNWIQDEPAVWSGFALKPSWEGGVISESDKLADATKIVSYSDNLNTNVASAVLIFTPILAGRIHLIATHPQGSLTTYETDLFTITPGVPNKIDITPDASINPGECFGVTLTVKDSENNTAYNYSGQVDADLEIIGADTPYGELFDNANNNRLEVNALAYLNFDGNPSHTGGSKSGTLSAVQGLIDFPGTVCLFDGTDASPQVKVSTAAVTNGSDTWPALNGISDVLTISTGSEHHIQVFVTGTPYDGTATVDAISGSADLQATPLCKWIDTALDPDLNIATCSSWQNKDPAANQLGGDVDTPRIFHAVSVDKGGNFVSLESCDWSGFVASGTNPFASTQFSASTASAVSTWTPKYANPNAKLIVSNCTGSSTLHATIPTKIFPGAVNKFGLEINAENKVSADSAFDVNVKLLDKHGNLAYLVSDTYDVTWSLSGAGDAQNTATPANPIPASTSPVYPASQSITFSSGIYAPTTKAFYLPNATGGYINFDTSVSLTITDSDPDTSPDIISKSIAITVTPGAVAAIQLRDEDLGYGQIHTSTRKVWINKDDAQAFYFAAYDAKGNFIPNTVADFSYTLTQFNFNDFDPKDTINSKPGSGTSVVFTPTTSGMGTIKATVDIAGSPVSAETGPITVFTQVLAFKVVLVKDTVETTTIAAGETFSLRVKALKTIDSSPDDHTDDLAAGIIATDYLGGNGSVGIQFNHNATASWASDTPLLPSGVFDCTFIAGICNVTGSNYKLTNSDEAPSIYVSDDTSFVAGAFSRVITVQKGSANRMAIADGSGAPGQTKPYAFNIVKELNLTADSPTQTFYSVDVDKGGNYIGLRNADWSSYAYANLADSNNASIAQNDIPAKLIDSNNFSASLTNVNNITYTPISVGILRLKVAAVGSPDPAIAAYYSGNIKITHGEPTKVAILPEHTTETAGVCFSVSIEIQDADSNIVTSYSSGAQTVPGITMDILNADTPYGTAYADTTNDIIEVNQRAYFNYANNPNKLNTLTDNFSVISGIVNYPGNICLYDATDSSPRIDITIPLYTDPNSVQWAAITGSSGIIPMSTIVTETSGHHIQVFIAGLATDPGSQVLDGEGQPIAISGSGVVPDMFATRLCDWINPDEFTDNPSDDTCSTWANANPAKTFDGGLYNDVSTARTMYAGLVDKGGNFVNLVRCKWQGIVESGDNPFEGAQLVSAVENESVSDANGTGIVTWTPQYANSNAKLSLTNCSDGTNTFTNALIPVSIEPGPPHHFTLSVVDNALDTVSVGDYFAVKVDVRDAKENIVYKYGNKTVGVSWSYNGTASNSPGTGLLTGLAEATSVTSLTTDIAAGGNITLTQGTVNTGTGFRLASPSGIYNQYDTEPKLTMTQTSGTTIGSGTTDLILTATPDDPVVITIRTLDYGNGTNIETKNMNTDQTLAMYVAGFDNHGNYFRGVNAEFTRKTDENPNTLATHDTIALIPTNAGSNQGGVSNTVLSPKVVSKGKIIVTPVGPYAALSPYITGLIDVVNGAFNSIKFIRTDGSDEDDFSVAAGTPFNIQLKAIDNYGNAIKYLNDTAVTNISFTIFGDDSVYVRPNDGDNQMGSGYVRSPIHDKVADGDYTFTEGVSQNFSFTLYNASKTPFIAATISFAPQGSDTSPLASQSSGFTVAAAAEDHYWTYNTIKETEYKAVSSGIINNLNSTDKDITVKVAARDQYGNIISAPNPATVNLKIEYAENNSSTFNAVTFNTPDEPRNVTAPIGSDFKIGGDFSAIPISGSTGGSTTFTTNRPGKYKFIVDSETSTTSWYTLLKRDWKVWKNYTIKWTQANEAANSAFTALVYGYDDFGNYAQEGDLDTLQSYTGFTWGFPAESGGSGNTSFVVLQGIGRPAITIPNNGTYLANTICINDTYNRSGCNDTSLTISGGASGSSLKAGQDSSTNSSISYAGTPEIDVLTSQPQVEANAKFGYTVSTKERLLLKKIKIKFDVVVKFHFTVALFTIIFIVKLVHKPVFF